MRLLYTIVAVITLAELRIPTNFQVRGSIILNPT